MEIMQSQQGMDENRVGGDVVWVEVQSGAAEAAVKHADRLQHQTRACNMPIRRMQIPRR